MEANYNEELNATKELLKGLSIHQETTHEAEEEKQYRPSISGYCFHSDSFELYACILLIRFEIITMANFSGDLSL